MFLGFWACTDLHVKGRLLFISATLIHIKKYVNGWNKFEQIIFKKMTNYLPNLKSISELIKMYMKSLDSFILSSRNNWVSCNQTLGCLRLYGDNRVSRAQLSINVYEILVQHHRLLFLLDIIGLQKHIPTYNFHIK